MVVTSTLVKRSGALALAAFIGLAPVLAFATGAQAAKTHAYKQTAYQTTRKNAGTPNSDNATSNSSGVVISYGNTAITYNAPSSSLRTRPPNSGLFSMAKAV